jgi:hypothetical protein
MLVLCEGDEDFSSVGRSFLDQTRRSPPPVHAINAPSEIVNNPFALSRSSLSIDGESKDELDRAASLKLQVRKA